MSNLGDSKIAAKIALITAATQKLGFKVSPMLKATATAYLGSGPRSSGSASTTRTRTTIA